MFMDWKTCKYVHTTPEDLQIQFNYKNSTVNFHRKKKIPSLVWNYKDPMWPKNVQ